MTISQKIKAMVEESSWVRKMFDSAGQLKAVYGEENIYDFSLGNPVEEPPLFFQEELKRIIINSANGMHRYMPNAGYPETRKQVADMLKKKSGLPFSVEHIIMTNGAAGGLNVALKTILNPGDEVIVLNPYFVEYKFYIDYHGGIMKLVDTNKDFTLNIDKIKTNITGRTKAIIVNSPNNPTGVIYSKSSLEELSEILKKKSDEKGEAIYILADEAYREIIYDNLELPEIPTIYPDTILIGSFSKSLGVPGERIGYIAICPLAKDCDDLIEGMVFSNRTLGFVNAPAIMQRVLMKINGQFIDGSVYQNKRDLLYENLTKFGYQVVKPQGAFYMFPKSPIGDDLTFVMELQKNRVLAVPGKGFGKPGYFRIAFCVKDEVIYNSLPIFEKVIKQFQ